MPSGVSVVPFGRPALDRLAGQVESAKAGDSLAAVTVVVPSNYVGVATRRALAARGGLVAVTFLTLHRLAELLGAARLAASGRRPVTAPVLAAAVRRVLAEDPGLFAPVADHPVTEDALAAVHRELADVSAEALDSLADQSARAADVVRIHRAVRFQLTPAWFDEHDLVVAAAESVEAGPRIAASLGSIIVYLPRDISRAGGHLLARLATHVPVHIDLGVTGDERADGPLLAAVAHVGLEVPTAPPVERPVTSRIVSVSDPDEEVRAAVHALFDAMREGAPLGRTAILYGASDPYARLVHEHLEAAGIPHNGTPVHTIGEALLGRTLRALLSLPDDRFRRRGVLGLLASAPVVDAEGRTVPSRAWERVSRAAAVAEGDDWAVRLAAFAGEQRARAEEAAVDGQERLAAHLQGEAEHADALTVFVAGLRDDLAAGAEATGWTAMVEWAQGLLDRYLGGERRRARWPHEERQAADRAEEALERLCGLDALDGPPPTLEVFRRTLDAELNAALRRVGRFGEGVLVAPVATAAGLCLDRVVVLGLAEGTFPARRQEDSLLPDREREATGGEIRPRSARADEDHRHLLAVIAGTEVSVLCFPRGDLRRPGDRTASRWLLEDAGILADETPVFTRDLHRLAGREWYEEVPSFTAGLARRAFPATAQEYDLGALLRSDTPVEHHPVVVADPALAAGVALALARNGAAFTRFDGNLASLEVTGPADGPVTSATRLETWASCPHRYLFEHVLGVDVVQDPELVLEMSALDRGSLVHEVLERFLGDSLALGRPTGRWTEEDRARLLAVTDDVCAAFETRGLTGRRVFWRRDRGRIVADLLRFLDEDDSERAERRSRPVAAELAFGVRGASFGPVEVPLPDGRSIRFRGSADRVDATEDGSLVVIDYKTGGAGSYEGLSEADPDQRGTRLQLPVYAAAARATHGAPDTPVHAAYWFVSAKGRFAWIGYDVTDALEARVGGVLATIADGIAAGVFPARPSPTPAWGYIDCPYCDPDGLGTADRRREWDRKKTDPALAAHVALAEPEQVAGGAG